MLAEKQGTHAPQQTDGMARVALWRVDRLAMPMPAPDQDRTTIKLRRSLVVYGMLRAACRTHLAGQ